MTVAFYMNCVSAHQIPLAREVARLIGNENFVYVDNEEVAQKLQMLNHVEDVRVVKVSQGGKALVEQADLVVTGLRDFALMEKRTAQGLVTYYYSERWFKPFHGLPGCLRMLVPRYRRMVKRFVKWANTDLNARVLAIGPWAKKDFLRMGISLDKIVDWGYYVKPSDALPAEKSDGTLRLLWCGRLLGWKRVGDIVRAVGEHVGLKRVGDSLPNVSLTIVGDGPEKERVMKMAKGMPIKFLPSQPADKIREIMREHDTFVFASNAYEGWGAVVSEALEEGMNVIGTYECGSCPTLLPKERLYHCGDVKALRMLIKKECCRALPPCSIDFWTAKNAAERLLAL